MWWALSGLSVVHYFVISRLAFDEHILNQDYTYNSRDAESFRLPWLQWFTNYSKVNKILWSVTFGATLEIIVENDSSIRINWKCIRMLNRMQFNDNEYWIHEMNRLSRNQIYIVLSESINPFMALAKQKLKTSLKLVYKID